VQRKISLNKLRMINIKTILYLLIFSISTALVFNYLNPGGLTIILSSDPEEDVTLTGDNTVEFFQPIRIDSSDALLLHSKGVQFLDTRTAEEFNSGHIPNAVNIPVELMVDAGEILDSFPKETPFVIYNGNAINEIDNTSASELFNAGYKRIYIYTGGYNDWIKNNYPLTDE